MKILSLKRLIGLGAIGGAVYYVRKHGGFRNALDELMGKTREADDETIGKAHEPTRTSYTSSRMMDDENYRPGGFRH